MAEGRADGARAGPPAAKILAQYAAALTFDDLPQAAVSGARDAILDTVGVCIGGSGWEPSRIGMAYADELAAEGASAILDGSGATTSPASAAFLNGLFSHAIEYDCLRKPGAGVHAAPVVAAALAIGQSLDRSGRDVIAAVAAGIEVMFRIGKATHHSCETKGFHAPGLTGPFGAAIAAGHLLRLDAEQMTNALGIAGSLASGLLEFAHSGSGSMVKKLHLARAAESGIVAARLAAAGMSGPATIIDGGYGFLAVFCEEAEPEALTAGLGSTFECENLCFKRYPCHITAHAPVEAILALKQRRPLAAGDIRCIHVATSPKAAKLHNLPRPADMGMAQYSIPFCIAVALARDPSNPADYSGTALTDPVLLGIAAKVVLEGVPAIAGRDPWAAAVTLELTDGTSLHIDIPDFPGMPSRPFTPAIRQAKFLALAGPALGTSAATVLARLEALEHETGLHWIAHPLLD